jgi:peptidoglycan/xylan/chitin deacetylase (PgdA/CDA1 family)
LSRFFRKRVLLTALFVLALFAAVDSAREIPILMYHRVDIGGGEPGLFVTPETFERQMEFLKIHGYHVVPLNDLVRDLKAGRRISHKTVVITFDDGNADNFRNAFPVLHKLNFPATIFMITGNIGREGWLTEEDLRILDQSDITIGSHTISHAFLPDLTSDDALTRELGESKDRLEKLLGHPVTLFSYPAGGFTERSKNRVIEQGYEGAVTTNHGKGRHDPYALHRIKVKDSGGNLFSFWVRTTGLYHLGKKRVAAKDKILDDSYVKAV